jgi:hypothetical protein
MKFINFNLYLSPPFGVVLVPSILAVSAQILTSILPIGSGSAKRMRHVTLYLQVHKRNQLATIQVYQNKTISPNHK